MPDARLSSTTAQVMALALRYAKASVLYLAGGSTLVLLTFLGVLQFSISAFYFMELYGFVAMMIFGISYLLVPAFSHKALHSLQLARYQFWLFNAGTIGLVVSFSNSVQGDWLKAFQVAAYALQVLAIYIHAYNIWRTASGWKGSPGDILAHA